jgi:hypothetical protein
VLEAFNWAHADDQLGRELRRRPHGATGAVYEILMREENPTPGSCVDAPQEYSSGFGLSSRIANLVLPDFRRPGSIMGGSINDAAIRSATLGERCG